MKILEKTMEQMPNSFTSNEFNKKAISNGYPKTSLNPKDFFYVENPNSCTK